MEGDGYFVLMVIVNIKVKKANIISLQQYCVLLQYSGIGATIRTTREVLPYAGFFP